MTGLEQIIKKLYMDLQKTQNCQAMLKEKNKAEGITLPDFRQYYKARVIKTVWYGSPRHGTAETNLTRNHEVSGWIPGLARWVKDLAMP